MKQLLMALAQKTPSLQQFIENKKCFVRPSVALVPAISQESVDKYDYVLVLIIGDYRSVLGIGEQNTLHHLMNNQKRFPIKL